MQRNALGMDNINFLSYVIMSDSDKNLSYRGPSYWCSSQKAAQACGEGVSFTSQCTNRLVKYFFSFYSIKNTIPRLWHTATRSIGRSTNNLTPELIEKPPGYSDGCFDGDFCIFHYHIFYWYLVFLIEV